MQSIKINDLVKWYINYSCDSVCKDAGVGLVTSIEEAVYPTIGETEANKPQWENQFVFYSVYSPEFLDKNNNIMIFEKRNVEKIQLLPRSRHDSP